MLLSVSLEPTMFWSLHISSNHCATKTTLSSNYSGATFSGFVSVLLLFRNACTIVGDRLYISPSFWFCHCIARTYVIARTNTSVLQRMCTKPEGWSKVPVDLERKKIARNLKKDIKLMTQPTLSDYRSYTCRPTPNTCYALVQNDMIKVAR